MRKFNEFLNGFRTVQPFFDGVDRLFKLRGVYEKNGEIAFGAWSPNDFTTCCPSRVTARQFSEFAMQFRTGKDSVQMYALAGLAGQGVKAFYPTVEQYEALSKIDMNLTWADYRQPFPVFCVVVPEKHPDAADPKFPAACISRINTTGRVVSMVTVGDPENMCASGYAWKPDVTSNIESHWHRTMHSDAGEDFTEKPLDKLLRVTINSCLLLVEYGAVRKGYLNPEFVAKLEAKAAKKSVPDHIREANRVAIRLVPDVYAFHQKVTLYDAITEPHPEGPGEYEITPHWRRGHWANVACGPKHSERRLTFRRAVLVNSHKFYGQPYDAKVSYADARPVTAGVS